MPQPLPVASEATPSSGAMAGRRRLSGAFLIDINRIEPDPDQPRKRIDPTHLDELAKSVKRLGVLQPITVRYIEDDDIYRIIAGECRYTACKQASLNEIPCWVKNPKADEILLEQIVENWTRQDLNPFELADSLAILRDANNLNQQDLVERTGKSKGEVSKLLSILALAPDVQRDARDDTTGRITKRHLYSLSRVAPQQQLEVLKRVRRDELSAIDMERLVKRMEKRSDKPKKGGAPVTRRRFATKNASVVFTYRKRDVSDTDMMMTLREVKKQIIEGSNDPKV
ncbi:MAG: ParB/RepB/Spo0J family partition protein [Planctomycetaceae bacterium]|nr:ParB/RepB/Spo0J family partition protein [Planctomycetaceae bacterium]